jgi:hypothetical protein
MILNAVLLTLLGRIVHNMQPNLDVATLPELNIESDDDIQVHVKNPISNYELLLTRTMGYGAVKYKDDEQEAKCMYAVISYNL